ncbi:hypothetical protein A3A20_00740 [Candidatus Wolfebacteria bacterium RIFCSPLOWO2_01_FULL_45_19]|uniref:TVP38/TMEM64 family membrane protein n=1 Tax=Candidatus Wolfebacteria bacterium RIFCSPLOWO2_01_FULL_45_19 TaxID=1802557 RepID=A0A1F8DRM6_9BACT|nr:MAG: hypothetical protein A3A20_00740 [Candidatus Wolfebacteria bacterium RIFCSPLOWO2_01_FULL_45_19]
MLKEKYRKTILLVILSAVLVFIFWGSTTLQAEYDNLVAFFESQLVEQPVSGIIIFFFLTILSAMFFFLSSIFAVPIAVSIWGAFVTMIFILSSWILGAIFSYIIGRFAGRPVLRHFVSKTKLDYYHRMFSENSGLLSVFLLRFTIPSEIPGYTLGILRFNFAKYMLVTILAEIPYAFVIVYAFEAILRKDPVILGAIVGAWLLAVIILIKLIHKKIHKMEKQ